MDPQVFSTVALGAFAGQYKLADYALDACSFVLPLQNDFRRIM